jgi:hypothetical protein
MINRSVVIVPAVAPVIISPPVTEVYIEDYRRIPAIIEWIIAPVPVTSVIRIVPSIIVVVEVIITPAIIINRIVERKPESESVPSVNA